MSEFARREFLKKSALGASVGGAVALGAATKTRAKGANDGVRVGLIGCGGRGTYLADQFMNVPGVEVAMMADPDERRLEQAAAKFQDRAPRSVSDVRQILDDKSIDAVIVATPDHWHAPASILACDAGKHVYVEKPCSHTVREGRLLVEAARRNNRVVQHGTQVRSTSMMIEAVAALREGIIGDVMVTKAWNIQRRKDIGRQSPSEPPAGFDYDMWTGPVPKIAYQRNRVHDGWHWWYHFGTGDMGNDGVHDVDYARWGLGVETHPSLITASGGKYFFDDDQEFPDTQQVTFEYPGDGSPGNRKMFIYEQRLWSTNYPHNVDSGVEFYGTKGQMFLSRRGKIRVLGERNKPVDVKIARKEQDAESHIANFVDCVRTGNRPNGEIEIGHLTATLCHLGNIATRLGRTIRFDPRTERIPEDTQADALLTREYRAGHWATPKGAYVQRPLNS
jgi:predicted dehydrogenase